MFKIYCVQAVEDGVDVDELEEKKKTKKQRKRKHIDDDEKPGAIQVVLTWKTYTEMSFYYLHSFFVY